jgi:hypothetical protein
MGSRQVVKGISPVQCPKIFFWGGGGRPKNFAQGRHRISQGKLADTPPQLKVASFAPG